MRTYASTRWFASTSVIAASLCYGGAAAASVLNTAQVGVNPNFTGGTGPYSDNVLQAGAIDIGGSATGGFGSFGSAAVHVDYGEIKLSGDSFGSLVTVSRGIFRDDVTIISPGVPTGTLGTLTFSVLVLGTMGSASGSSYAGWQLQADLGGGAFDINAGAHVNSPELIPSGYIGDPFGVYSGTITFQFGFSMPLDVELTGSAVTGFTDIGPGEAHFDLAHSLYWNGISNVMVGGAPVDSFGATSASGTNWANPIPEPVAGLLLLGILPTLRRVRRS